MRPVVLIHTGINIWAASKIQKRCETEDGEEYNSYSNMFGGQAGLSAPQLLHWRTAHSYLPPAEVPGNTVTT